RIERIQIAVQTDIAVQLLLVEVNRASIRRSRRPEITSRELAWRSAIERDAVQSRKVVRRPDRIQHFERAVATRWRDESRPGDHEPVSRQPPGIVLNGR